MEKVNQIKSQVSKAEEIINGELLPKTSELYSHVKEFHASQIKDYDKMINTIDGVNQGLREKLEQCETYLNQIRGKKSKESQFSEKGHGFLEAKNQQIKSKVKNIDAVTAGIKQTVGKIKPEKLKKLPVKDDRNLQKLFQTLFKTLYSQNKNKDKHEEIHEEKFSWDVFRKLALKHEGGEDFIFRMVNINFQELPRQKIEELMKLKTDPEFEHFVVNTPHALDIIDLADWVQYVCLGFQFSSEKKKAEKERDKIMRDLNKKSEISLQISEKFWDEASKEVEEFHNDLQNIESDLKSIMFGLRKSVQDCKEQEQMVEKKVSNLNEKMLTKNP